METVVRKLKNSTGERDEEEESLFEDLSELLRESEGRLIAREAV